MAPVSDAMSSNRTRSSWSHSFVMLLLLAGGCGLAEYEEKMVKEQKRIDQIDEEAKYLGEPAEVIMKTEQGAVQTPNVFFRLPKGIVAKSDGAWGDLFFRYSRVNPAYTGRFRTHGAAEQQESPFQEIYIAAAPPGDWKEFTDKVQQPFQGMQRSEVKPYTREAGGRRLDFQTVTYTETATLPTHYLVYFYQSPQGRVAIVFRLPFDKVGTPEVLKATDVCLQSLAVGPEAAVQRQRYKPQT